MAKTAASILARLIIIQREHDRSNLNLGIMYSKNQFSFLFSKR
jgi:hypothetical protein